MPPRAPRTDPRPGPEVGLWAYPWDLADEGWDRVLPLIAGLGVTTLRVAASYHSVQGYFPHNPKRPVLRADAGVYFSPEPSRYAETPLRPVPSPLLPEIGELAGLVARAHAEGLRVVAWTVCLHTSALAGAHPEAAQLGIFGQRHPAALCPANPHARAYVLGLVRDLVRNQGVDGVELEAAHYASWLHHPHRKVAAPPDPLRELLLSLCVCRHCAARGAAAGADLSEVVAVARRRVTCGEEQRDAPRTVEEAGARSPSLGAFLRARRESVSSLVAEVREVTGDVPLLYFGPEDDAATGIDWQAIGQVAEVLELPAYVASAAEARAIVRHRVTASGLAAGRWTVGLSVGHPEATSRQHLLETVDAVLDEGVGGVSFYNYGLVPSSHLPWVRDAADAARTRGSREVLA